VSNVFFFATIGRDVIGFDTSGLEFSDSVMQVIGFARTQHEAPTRFAQGVGHLKS
jgi:hypothetical protein